MKTLIVINNLGCGGAQKSLISLLNELTVQQIEIDLLVLNQKDVFFDQIPAWINQLGPVAEISAMHSSFGEGFKTIGSKAVCLKMLLAKCLYKISKNPQYDTVQNLWNVWKRFVPMQSKKYDLAISYVDGFSNYYVMDKVVATKKILWIHNEYEKLSYNSEYDRAYFNKADRLVTISERCVKSLEKVFPECSSKIRMLYNISSTKMIWQLAEKNYPDEYRRKKNILVSIGRLNTQKGFDLAIQAAKIIEEKGVEFTWFIIGEGEDEQMLREQIKKERLDDSVKLVGIRKNPYPYIRYADVFVQPSRYEGKSIVLDEAKILCKPIVVTNYTTVVDSITDIFIRYIDSFFLESSVKTSKSVSCDRGIFSVNIGNLSVSPFKNIRDKFFHSLNVVGNNSNSSIKYMIDSDYRYLGLYQALYLFCKKIDTGDHHSIDSTVTAVLIITEMLTGEVSAGKSDVISSGFGSAFKAFQYMIEIIMGEATHGFVYKKYAKIITASGL